jgi:hypothetical protein
LGPINIAKLTNKETYIMKKITFKWSGAIITGTITEQIPSSIQGQKTTIAGNDGVEYTLYGKCQVGNCGPFTIISIN